MAIVQVYINGQEVDIVGTLSTSLNYEISDVARPESRQANYSKTIELAGSKRNNILFSHIFDVNHDIVNATTTNFTPDFNPNLKASAQIVSDGEVQFDGVVQLLEIKKSLENKITYSVIIIAKLGNLFTNVSDKDLTDLDLSTFNHEYNITNITDSWATQIQEGGAPVAFALGNGYTYPMVEYGTTDLITYKVEDFKPALYIKTIWDKIWSDAGYTYTSTFLNQTFFKSILQLANVSSLRLSAAEILDRQFKASTSATITLPNTTVAGQSQTVLFDNDSTGGNFDSSAQYTPGTGIFLVAASHEMNASFTTKLIFQAVFTVTDGAYAGQTVQAKSNLHVIARLMKYTNATGATTQINAVGGDIFKPSTFITSYTTSNPATPSTDFTGVGFGGVNANEMVLTGTNIYLDAGDYLFIKVEHYLFHSGVAPFSSGITGYYHAGTGTTFTGTYSARILADSTFYNNCYNATIIEGQQMTINSVLPKNIKQKDWLISIIKRFNLYIEESKTVSNQFIVEPRDDYYNTNLLDWTLKHDQINDTVIKPMGALEAIRYIFTDKEDKDYYNERYQGTWNEAYGTRTIDVNNDFNKNTKKIETIFSPTPLVGNDNFDRVIPHIRKIDTSGVASQYEGNPRLLYYGGLKPTSNYWIFSYNFGANSQNHTTYPYAGHYDDPYNPTIDLSWGATAEVYYDNRFQPMLYTNNNCYNRFYKKQIDEVTDKNSKIVEAWFNLKPYDITQVDFRSLYRFDNAYFRLNKIIDYDPIGTKLTKCEFLKIQEGGVFVPNTGTLDNSVILVGTERMPVFGNNTTEGNNVGKRTDEIVQGRDNRNYGDVANIISGNRNTIGLGSRNVTIFSNDVTVDGGLENVFVFNSPNVTVTESNTTIINGVYYSNINPEMGRVVMTTQSYTQLAADSTILVDCSGANRNITLMSAADSDIYDESTQHGKIITIKKIDSGNFRVGLVPNGSETIDGETAQSLFSQYDTIRLQSDGTDWKILETYAGVSKVSTTDATNTVIATIPIATGTGMLVNAYIRCIKTGGAGTGTTGDVNAYIRTVKVKNVAGVLTIGSVSSAFTSEDIGAFNATFVISGTNLNVQVSGSANNNVDWECKLDYFR